jgi:hypothetical protein
MTQPPYACAATFRVSTNADEDWTKISDSVERRRIQNRIAQRNYRMLDPVDSGALYSLEQALKQTIQAGLTELTLDYRQEA